VNAKRLTYTVTEAANVLGISRALAYELVARDELPSIRLGRRIVIPAAALKAVLEEQWIRTSTTNPRDQAASSTAVTEELRQGSNTS